MTVSAKTERRPGFGAPGPGERETGGEEPDLRRRSTIVGWLAFGFGFVSFSLLLLSRGTAMALQFSSTRFPCSWSGGVR